MNNQNKKILLMFPGQGSQYIGMGNDFLNKNNEFMEYFNVSSLLIEHNLLDILNNINNEGSLLEQTQYSQISIFTLSSAINDYLFKKNAINKNSNCDFTVIGHSLGDYSAIYSSGMLDYENTARLVAYRGKIMAEAGSQIDGMMAAVIGAEKDIILDILKKYENRVFIANLNDYLQTVISGYTKDIIDAINDLKNSGIRKIIPLKVNIASHCPLMKEVSEKLGNYLNDNFDSFAAPEFDYFSSTQVAYIDNCALKDVLVQQLVKPVRWLNSIEYILTNNFEIFIEIGPGKVLSGLVKRIASRCGMEDKKIFSTDSQSEIESVKNFLVGEGIINGS